MKISWSKALADYLKDETQSYSSIASKYGVSKMAVCARAKIENWQGLRQKTLLKVNQNLTDLVSESVADTNARQAQMGKLLQAIALKAIKDKDLKPENIIQAVRSIVDGIKIERQALGLDKPETTYPKQNIFRKADYEY